jgi:hypothetical protein
MSAFGVTTAMSFECALAADCELGVDLEPDTDLEPNGDELNFSAPQPLNPTVDVTTAQFESRCRADGS